MALMARAAGPATPLPAVTIVLPAALAFEPIAAEVLPILAHQEAIAARLDVPACAACLLSASIMGLSFLLNSAAASPAFLTASLQAPLGLGSLV